MEGNEDEGDGEVGTADPTDAGGACCSMSCGRDKSLMSQDKSCKAVPVVEGGKVETRCDDSGLSSSSQSDSGKLSSSSSP